MHSELIFPSERQTWVWTWTGAGPLDLTDPRGPKSTSGIAPPPYLPRGFNAGFCVRSLEP
ncbi:hypothetical protein ColLi_06584 [Colletotrichum liriopes]|uniref:Uncharacterized protein n=1 Tax=Colletotrichum liriopes TaxID=708192 RepID=A0AA37GMG2_9PEZI|nr:hypothetical protein ColLi_06584 [Colletotrichum liriopes]